MGGFSRFPFGTALARVPAMPPPPPNRVHCHWKGEIFLLVRIARCDVGGNVSLRFSDSVSA